MLCRIANTARHHRRGRPFAWGLAALAAVLAGPPADAAWHGDLEAARAAAATSGRPVLAVITASWQSANGSVEQVLASPESEAVVSACFEAVRLDADAHVAAVQTLGVSHVPAGCVLAADGTVLRVFDMPGTTAEFVASVARLAQEAAGTPSPGLELAPERRRDVVEHRIGQRTAAGSTADGISVFERSSPFAGTGLVQDDVESGRGSISMVTAKLRRLSDFATDAPVAATPALAADRAVAARSHDTIDGRASIASAEEPSLAESPPGWPAEQVGPLTATTVAPAHRAEIAPAGAAAAATVAPWRISSTAPVSNDPWGRPLPAQPILPMKSDSPTLDIASPAERDIAATTATPASASPTPVLPAPGSPNPDSRSAVAATPPAAPSTPHASPVAVRTADPVTGAADSAAAPAQMTAQATAQAAPPDRAEPQPPAADPGTAAEAAAEAPRQSGFVAALQKPFTMWWRKDPVATEPPTLPPARSQRAATLAADAAAAARDAGPAGPEDVHGSMPLGLEGYCPVTLVDTGTWAEGRAQWGARHRGRTYLFVGADQQAAFLANPDRYAPALSGDDPVLAMESGVSKPGQRRYGVTYESRMYLFASPESRAAFAADPVRYTRGVLVAERGSPAGDQTRRY